MTKESLPREVNYTVYVEEQLVISLLSACVNDKVELLNEINTYIDDSHFLDDRLREIYLALLKCAEKGIPFDCGLLARRLWRKRFRIDAAYMYDLFERMVNWADCRYYAAEVLNMYRRRRIAAEAATVSDDIIAPESDIDGMLADIGDLPNRYAPPPEHGVSINRDVIIEALDDLEGRPNESVMGETGIGAVDDRIPLELTPTTVTVIAARPSAGKSSMSLQLMCHQLFNRAEPWYVYLAQLEGSNKALIKRMIKWLNAAPNSQSIANAASMIDRAMTSGQLVLRFSDRLEKIALDVKRLAKTANRKGRPMMVIIDYLQLVEPKGDFQSDAQRIGAVTRRIKTLAQETGVVMVTPCQLNREGEDQPGLRHLRGSGTIEQDADNVVFLHSPDVRSDSPTITTHFIIGKQRENPIGACDLTWVRPSYRFYSQSKEF